ncbi:MAG: hypothetical protein KatS3mg119_1293 [Rhodothalassiaceae bacterium]|nr:MAG: hypothetical protein KatS3mg119_1293 [Rhodothalassiaceae bacterium]
MSVPSTGREVGAAFRDGRVAGRGAKRSVLLRLAVALVAGSFALFAGMGAASAEPTRVVVHVLAQGAKFIGSSVGGAEVTIRDAATGALLAHGVTSGTTGDTARIMRARHPRNRVLSTPDAARFEAVLDIDAPREVVITARGPLAAPQATAEASTRLWLLPGVDRTAGDGVLLELSGLIVAPVTPAFHTTASAGAPVALETRLLMLCGCPIAPGLLWDAADFSLSVRVTAPDGTVTTVPLGYGGRTSHFTGSFTPPAAGVYRLEWLALQKSTGQVGRAETTLIVTAS